MLSDYFPVVVLFGLGLTIGGVFLGLSALLGRPRRVPAARGLPYECGLEQAASPRQRFAVHFFLTAMLFLLFDVEVTFLFPWAILFRQFVAEGAGLFILVEGLLFIGILALGLVYVWKRGALTWER